MDQKQIRLLNWMFNFCVVEMKANKDKFLDSDIILLTEAVYRRFPDEADSITEEFQLGKL